ncbi:hypothetical protein N3K66_008904 [Trichothecium roseum]|uniref:Uncharacterized protein n=1 Tax=Trichothecium roseum TaxID=47278 RepID=A0ACC0UU19_9HYPO|nr:hypothetical protein N3K66_008904 [Trichothecium roseum]
MSDKMDAWQFTRPGPISSVLRLSTTTVPKPELTSDQDLLLEVVAAALNPADYKLTEMGLAARAALSYPKTPGMDLSARVVAVGAGVDDIRPGDTVVCRLSPFGKQGALSRHVVAPRSDVAKLPSPAAILNDGSGPAIDPAVLASGLGTAALTAYQTIAPYVRPDAHDRVFINGGSGGVGSLGIQVAKLLGCHVTTTCSTPKVDLCRSLGADVVIDYRKQDVVAALRAEGHVFSVVADNVCDSPHDLYPQSQHFLRPGAPYVFVGGRTSLASVSRLLLHLCTPRFLGGRQRPYVQYFTKTVREDLEQVAAWFAQGKLRIVAEDVYEFSDALAAFERVKKGTSKGKVIVKVMDSPAS